MTRKGTVVFIDNKKEESYEIEVVKDGVYFRLKGHTIFVPHQQIKRIKFHD